jgi:hypothetical protein
MKRTFMVSILTVIGCLVPISIIAQEVGKQGNLPASPKVVPLNIEEIQGEWSEEEIGDDKAPEGAITIKADETSSEDLVLDGKYTDWDQEGHFAEGKITFVRKPTAEQMSEKAPLWARQKIEAEGKLKWKLELKAEKREGEYCLEGKWFPGEFKWNSAGGRGAEEASYLGPGKPLEVKFRKPPVVLIFARCVGPPKLVDKIYLNVPTFIELGFQGPSEKAEKPITIEITGKPTKLTAKRLETDKRIFRTDVFVPWQR